MAWVDAGTGLVGPLPVGVMAAAVAVALAADRWWGEPPAWAHPVVAMGRYLQVMGRWAAPPAGQPATARAALTRGTFAWLLGAGAVVVLAVGLQAVALAWPWWAQALWLGLWLKPLLAWRLLRDEVAAVEAALRQSLAAGRAQVARLVSRDVAALDESGVREAALSTLVENLNDSVVAPLLWFALLGLPGAALYRFANTADAMWGYRGERAGRDWTWAGRWAARADDVLSWLPARLTALLLAPGLWGRAWPRLRAEAGRTPSPNGGWPMAALALRRGVRLRKPGVYVLHAAGRRPVAADTRWALQRCGRVVGVLAAVAASVALGWAAMAGLAAGGGSA